MVLEWLKRKLRSDEPDKQQSAPTHDDIIDDYGAFLESNPHPLAIWDETVLPHNKSVILDNLVIAIATPGYLPEERQAFMTCALTLSRFQNGVGKHPLYPLGVDMTAFDVKVMAPESLQRLILSNPAGKEKYDRFQSLVQQEMRSIGERLHKAELVHDKVTRDMRPPF